MKKSGKPDKDSECISSIKSCAKGVKSSVKLEKLNRIDLYEKCLKTGQEHNVTQMRILQYNHQLYTAKERKIALSACDNKRYLIDYKTTLPLGYYNNNCNH